MEQSFVAWAKMRANRLPQVKIGIGDDAAILAADGCDIVVTTDSLMDGIHFRLSEVSPRVVGRKLASVNLSDLAAMAAQPVAMLVSLCLPRRSAQEIAAEVFEGVCEVAAKYSVAIAGGDTNCWDGPLVLNLTAIGRVVDQTYWTRSGAKAGDLVVVTGPLGGSLLGKHLDFEPQLELAGKLRGNIAVHAAMDISDGLSVDLLRMCDASGCGAILQLEDIPIADAARSMARESGKTPVEHALGDGEDFELILAIPPSELAKLQQIAGPQHSMVIGAFTSRTGLWTQHGSRLLQLPTTGYVHK